MIVRCSRAQGSSRPPQTRKDLHATGPGQLDKKPPIAGVKNLVAVASGKGGVGKTTVAVNLAIALKNLGATVGLLDADVYGPNVPVMLGTTEQPRAIDEQTIIPVQAYGVKMISMGLLNPGDKPLVWRGPMLHSVMQQFLRSVRWGELDYLIVDLPPGTGDVQLTLIQSVAVTGAVVVTTPSVVALADVRKAIEMFRQVNVEILGVVENMSYFNCPHCQGRIDVFGHGEGERMAQTFGVPFLGEIEIDPQIRIGGDTGKPVASLGEDAPGGKSIYAMARNVIARLAAAQRPALLGANPVRLAPRPHFALGAQTLLSVPWHTLVGSRHSRRRRALSNWPSPCQPLERVLAFLAFR